MAYQVEFSKKAIKQLEALPKSTQNRIRTKMAALAENPRASGVIKLEAKENSYRVRVGSFRVIYEIHDDRLLVFVVRVGHRSDVYRE